MKERAILDAALAALRREGCEGEVFLELSKATKVAVSGRVVESLEVREERGIGIRAFKDRRIGFSFTADLSSEGISRAAARAAEIAALVEPDPANQIPRDDREPQPLELLDRRLAEVPIARKIELALATEEAAFASDRRVSHVRQSAYEDGVWTVAVANTAGLAREATMSRAVLSIELKATEGEAAQTGWHAAWGRGVEGLDPAGAGREAAGKATSKLGAMPATTARMAVVLSPEVTASLLGELSVLFSAEAVIRGRSLLAGRIGQPIANARVTLVDDGTHPLAIESQPFDGEGVATRRTTLIENGVLRGWLHSSYTATRMKESVTGNALRGGFASRPGISKTNLILRDTGVSAERLLAGVTEGVYVMEVMGLHTINAVTGDFSLGASGLRISSGRLAGPVDRMVIAGEVLGLLSSIEAVANDIQFLVSGPGATVLLRNLAVSGQ